MRPNQIETKTNELELWLKVNPNHPNRTIIESDLRHLRSQLKHQDEEEVTTNEEKQKNELPEIKEQNTLLNNKK